MSRGQQRRRTNRSDLLFLLPPVYKRGLNKRARYMAEWLRKPEVDRPLLMPEDAQ